MVLWKQNGRNMNGRYDYEKCVGLKVKPRQGDAIFFYNLFPNGTIDQVSVPDNQKPHLRHKMFDLSQNFGFVVADISTWKLSCYQG